MQAAAGSAELEVVSASEVENVGQLKNSRKAAVRVGTRAVGGHFAPEVQKQLKLLAVENDTTNQELLREALNLLFSNYGKPPIA